MELFLDDVVNAVGEPEASAAFPLDMRLTPFSSEEGDPDFSEPNVRKAVKLTGTNEHGEAKLLEAAEFLRKNGMYRLAATYMYRGLYHEKSLPYIAFSSLDAELAGQIRMLIKVLSVFPAAKWHREQNIPEKISRDTLAYLHADNESFAGCCPDGRAYSWHRQLLDPKLSYLHILRFGNIIDSRGWASRVFRHKNGSYVSFAVPGLPVDRRGIAMTQEEFDREGGFMTTFRVENGHFVGHLIDDRGRIMEKPEKVPVSGYSLFVTDGMPAINMHIPMGGGMTPEITHESWRAAKRFFTERLGDACPKFIACWSWTCSPLLEDILPADSNLVKYVKSIHRQPNGGGDGGMPCFIHEGTSLHRAMDTYLKNGNRFLTGSMFMPLDEI